MIEIWANYLLPKALKTCPKSNKSPTLVTLLVTPDSITGSPDNKIRGINKNQFRECRGNDRRSLNVNVIMMMRTRMRRLSLPFDTPCKQISKNYDEGISSATFSGGNENSASNVTERSVSSRRCKDLVLSHFALFEYLIFS